MFLLAVLLLAFNARILLAEEGPKIEMGISEYTKTFQGEALPKRGKGRESTADHSQYEELQGPFASGPEVTKACLKCHNKAGDQFIHNKHWTWKYKDPITGQQLGKATLVNGFCTNAKGNEGMCAQCHAGYGWKDDSFDFARQENIDCLVCHDSTGSYYKTPNSSGNKACSVMFKDKPPIDWPKVAQGVGKPSRGNCGKCHFYGGGGDNVKHGDLSSVLFNPTKKIDVHMDAQGLNFSCVTCHLGEGHKWAGSRYQMHVGEKNLPKPGMPREVATCESCHGAAPHSTSKIVGIKLNTHTNKVACETCHIPEIARGGVATVTDWDWRSMGKLKNGEGYKEEGYIQGNGQERATYKSIKGDFTNAENIRPVYAWFDGQMKFTTIDTRFDPSKAPVDLNTFSGFQDNPRSRIYPFKRMHTIQPYDKGNNTLVYMHLWGDDENALWGNYDFQKAITAGMKKNGIPYSGEYGFVETYSYWPINHMVAPKEDVLACEACHEKEGRLKELKGFYMPGAGGSPWIDSLGLLIILGTLGGVLGHGLIRIISATRRKA
ncbi:MAG: tetrathionate reductase family octaheme c-type cytochrome [Gammaproteobacteria bacterium]|nr:tetrathionate reductase family octaheme c-type cytochrome [Gammaproteobacteria bacterium]MBU1653503.1 tetrathionate reductase family octaheme c-type cytochrome [Gammaproteobacteria bacterium]MBU1961851.1 tetrathionate reductase family octaheme c-type cytochrome [Gammaproteobacteria bacterium]